MTEHASLRAPTSLSALRCAALRAGLLGVIYCAAGCAATTSQATREQKELAHETSTRELMRKGEASSALGDMTRAEQYFVMALKSGTEERAVVKRLLVVCVADERYPVAAEYAENYLRRHPEDADIAYAAATLHAALGDAARARALLQTLTEKRPDWPEPHFTLASVLRQQGDDEALALADTHDLAYLKLVPNGQLADMAKARLLRRMQ